MPLGRRRLSALAMLVTAALIVPNPLGGAQASDQPAGQTPAPALLKAAPETPTLAKTRSQRTVQRVRAVAVDHSLLPRRASGQRISIAPFPDVKLDAVIDKSASVAAVGDTPRYRTWTGHLAGESHGYFIAVKTGDSYVYNVASQGGVYEILPGPDGAYQVTEVKQVREPNDSVSTPKADRRAAADTPAVSTRIPARPIPPVADDGSVVDVAILMTPRGLQTAGGWDQAYARAALAIAEANEAYANSGVVTRLRLVGVNGTTTNESTSMLADLRAIEDPVDGRFDDVPAYRDAFQADMVQVWMGSAFEPYCGLGAMDSPDMAYSIVDWSCATGNYSSTHEFGHNLGLQHDAYAGDIAAYPGGYGWVNLAGANSFTTVMAYPNQCMDAGLSRTCPRLLYISNPGVAYNGAPTGTSNAQNALVLNQTAARMAAQRSAPTLSGDPRWGNTLTLTPGIVPAGGTITAFEWYLGDTVIPGVTGTSVTIPREWLGQRLTATYLVARPNVRTLRIQTSSVLIQPALFAAVTTPRLKVKKKKRHKRVVKVKIAPWAPQANFSVKWFRGKKKMRGSSMKHKVTRRDYGKRLWVEVTGSADGYEATIVKSTRIKIRRPRR